VNIEDILYAGGGDNSENKIESNIKNNYKRRFIKC